MAKLSDGAEHKLPTDMRTALAAISELWEDLTPLARTEFICWIDDAKKAETRIKRIDWMISDLKKGKRRPCCWPGYKNLGKYTPKGKKAPQ